MIKKNEANEKSLGLKKVPLDELKSRLGLPKDAVFRGYLVHIEQADEFLGFIEDTSLSTQRGFVKSPEQAVVFDEFSDAFKVARPEKNEIVVGMFDSGKQLLICEIM